MSFLQYRQKKNQKPQNVRFPFMHTYVERISSEFQSREILNERYM